jgi:hypothetical protein
VAETAADMATIAALTELVTALTAALTDSLTDTGEPIKTVTKSQDQSDQTLTSSSTQLGVFGERSSLASATGNTGGSLPVGAPHYGCQQR